MNNKIIKSYLLLGFLALGLVYADSKRKVKDYTIRLVNDQTFEIRQTIPDHVNPILDFQSVVTDYHHELVELLDSQLSLEDESGNKPLVVSVKNVANQQESFYRIWPFELDGSWRPWVQHIFNDFVGEGMDGLLLRAVDSSTGTIWALKYIFKTNGREGEILQRMDRKAPHSLKIPHGVDYIGMRWESGTTFKNVWEKFKANPAQVKASRLITLVKDAIDELHGMNYSHCDLNMKNMMYDEHSDKIALIDFGRSVRHPSRCWNGFAGLTTDYEMLDYLFGRYFLPTLIKHDMYDEAERMVKYFTTTVPLYDYGSSMAAFLRKRPHVALNLPKDYMLEIIQISDPKTLKALRSVEILDADLIKQIDENLNSEEEQLESEPTPIVANQIPANAPQVQLPTKISSVAPKTLVSKPASSTSETVSEENAQKDKDQSFENSSVTNRSSIDYEQTPEISTGYSIDVEESPDSFLASYRSSSCPKKIPEESSVSNLCDESKQKTANPSRFNGSSSDESKQTIENSSASYTLPVCAIFLASAFLLF